MKLTKYEWLHASRRIGLYAMTMVLGTALGQAASAQAVSTTTVQGTVYLANGQPGAGTLVVSWPAFTTAAGQAVAADKETVTIQADGFVSLNLAPNQGATPAGEYYTAVLYMSDGTVSTQYWVVPAAAQATLAQVQAQVMPAAQAVQTVSKSYVDQAIQELSQTMLTASGGTLDGPLTLTGDPTQPLQAADKHYVDTQVATAVPLTGGTMTGELVTPTATANVNKVISVIAPPYNAKCDGVTEDTAAIQAALNDAKTDGYSVRFPAGTCLTGTLTYYGQTMFGAGVGLTIIKGEPGDDVFQTPDSAVSLIQQAYIHDMTIEVDSSVNAASSAVGGNNTFPNRISGTAGGTSALSTPPAPGPRVFASGGSITSGSTTFTLSGANFTSIPAALVVGAPVTIDGAGASGANLATTIATVVSATQVTVAASASTTVTNAGGKWGSGIQPPWYFGNCAFAFPASDGANMATGLIGWTFKNLFITGVNYTAGSRGNYTCGIFIQASPNNLRFNKVDVQNLWGGIIEAPPAANNTSYFAWTNDTSVYDDTVLFMDMIPMTWYNGSHRIVNGINIYDSGVPMALGLFQFEASLGTSYAAPSATISQYYLEPYAGNSGEVQRFHGIDVIQGGSLYQAIDASYTNWMGSRGFLDAQIQDALHISGNQNTFQHTGLNLGDVTDAGFDNSVETGYFTSDAYEQRRFYADSVPPQNPVGKLDGGFLLNGDSQTPFLSGSDLVTTCRDYRFATGGSASDSCLPDSGDASNIAKSYIHHVGTGGVNPGVAAYFSLFAFGNRIPMTKVYMVVKGRCNGTSSCNAIAKWNDATTGTQMGYCTLTFGSDWTIQGGPRSAPSCLVDYSAVTAGDVFGFTTNGWYGSPSSVDIAWIAFEPVNNDAATEIAGDSLTYTGNNTFSGSNTYSGALANGVTATTQTVGDNSTKVATDAFVQSQISASSFVATVPTWLQFLGDGSEGAYSCTAGICYLVGEHWYSSFSISSGATVATNTSNGQAPTVVRVTGACTITGTFSLSFNSGGTTGQVGQGNWGATGGGGGGGAAAGSAGAINTGLNSGGAAGAASGGAGGDGSSPSTSWQKEFLSGAPPVSDKQFNSTIYYYGGAAGGSGGSSGGAGGRGGGALVLVCGSLDFSGTIDVSGQAGGNSTGNNIGAGGGGGGGFVIMRSPNWIANTGTINVSGGTGGSCGSYTGCGAGGAGGDGWDKQFMN